MIHFVIIDSLQVHSKLNVNSLVASKLPPALSVTAVGPPGNIMDFFFSYPPPTLPPSLHPIPSPTFRLPTSLTGLVHISMWPPPFWFPER